ncbi:MAG: hypothetical protein A2655_00525 [Candidatus Yanofskybacteria bacterium RIFCSPHIGHO2_01_FULL_43_42]|uniref:CxxC-x17-CxxC domain-containing protein n=1 Tax=Candidatus Yanofskybacteria bacterium RIFCSPLOWO2_01_FULL_43_22 TaxID=1802695 RepID=A0A1F8GGT8_9BACT|nr:MAG: hypothetical protein A2655_00525 [Candidatus Yanofskybacteria bacterium RIFCSPHIGHO2_01_FULL_43_42]OGN13741.1 MAG: hypothetical protein A3D48_00275 [Candidatus Yanofskybacteria bacterium RIFCSPHIGHO2_02_FULL_43_17]OGN24260.1 MAG: hypothetical protein A3A13_03720 [Candidatus Yanofskybacteria bacterium RIFCSPLOWO2_01_FULL_43_22]
MAYDNDGGGSDYNRGGQGDFPPRKMYSGSWNCSKCGKEITELPFEPDPARLDKLLCRDCHRDRKQSFRRN